MELSPVKIVWGDYENETLIHNHKMAKLYKKRYQRASDLYNSLFSFFGLITVVSSSIATTLSWGSGDDISPNQQFILSGFTAVSALSAAIQNFYKFQEKSEIYTKTALIVVKNAQKYTKNAPKTKLACWTHFGKTPCNQSIEFIHYPSSPKPKKE